MVIRRKSLVICLIFLLASCVPNEITREGMPDQPPVPSPTVPSNPGTPQLVILSPLQIDSANGRLYADAQVNGESKIAILDAHDGRLIAAWDGPGQLAIDADRARLVVDRGAQGVALLDAATGETQAVVELPPQDGPPAPQVDARTGHIYAFRESTMFVIDPATREVITTVPFKIDRTVCDAPGGDATIYQTAYDPAGDKLYLSFISYSCIPWISSTVVAYDTSVPAEIGRTEVDINTQFVAIDEGLFGMSVTRLGPTVYWAWDGVTRWHDESGDYQGQPAGMIVDRERDLIYEAIGEIIRIIDPDERTLTAQVSAPLLAESRLAGHDPASDNLYFVGTTGRLYLWPASNLFEQVSGPPATAPSPLPAAAVREIALAPNWTINGTMAAVLDDPECAGGRKLYVMINPATGWASGSIGTESLCQSVAAVAFSPAYRQDSLIFAATDQPPTIARSLDTGRSWTAAATTFPDGTQFKLLLPSPGYAADQTIFALTTAGLFYRSRDGGLNWQLLDQRLDQAAITGGSGPTHQIFGVFNERVLRSTNGGESWQEAGPTPDGEPLSLLATAPSAGEDALLYAFTDGGRFLRSLDGGVMWNAVMETSPGPVQIAIAAGVAEAQRPVFLLHDRSITASFDGMASVWASASADEAGRFRPTAIAISPDFAAKPYLFAGTIDGQIIRVRADAQP